MTKAKLDEDSGGYAPDRVEGTHLDPVWIARLDDVITAAQEAAKALKALSAGQLVDRAAQARASFGRVVSLYPDPFDIRPAVDAIVEAFNAAASCATLQRPVILLFGESHANALHKIVQLGVLSRLKDQGLKFGFGYEYPYDLIEQVFGRVVSEDSHPDLLSAMKRDPLGVAIVRWKRPFAPVTRDHLFYFCRASRIRVAFNDVSRVDDLVVVEDPATQKVMARLFGHEPDILPVHHPLGLYARNAFMAERIMRRTRAAHPCVYIQHCGMHHVFGTHTSEAYRQSLSYQLAAHGAAVVPVYFDEMEQPDLAEIPSEAVGAMPKHSVLIQTQDNPRYFAPRYLKKNFKKIQEEGYREPDMSERAYLDAVREASGRIFDIPDVDGWLARIKAERARHRAALCRPG
ncbi:MAG: hypothetical protein H6865_05685 [Rhodospirillales bacterium]|nr:hypothetical protein [Alphaproteobacteria bacterium]MCB9987112.1 hypothetical protein [Rhodospirillales bacterium]USO08129.1 MAG: hypothetical protein H6866_02610 [Rhodospirillales bacterium]